MVCSMLYLMNRGAVFESCTQRLKGAMNSGALMKPSLVVSIIWNSCCRSLSSMSITRRRLWNSWSLRAPSTSSSKLIFPLPRRSIRSKTACKNFRSFSSSNSSSSAKLRISLWRASANVSTTTATIRFSTPKTRVSSDPTKITAVAGYFSMTGTAMSPQPSPAMTVLKSRRFASMTDCVARRHWGQSWKTPDSVFKSCTRGFTTSTMNMAHTVIMRKQKTKDQAKALKHVAIMVTSFCSSRSARVFRSKRINRTIRANRKTRSTPIRRTMSSSSTVLKIKST
mmetsp:Transcript_106533/g.254342  ORF Transcript_106533/g.254342 Transcript_106533/m.254342 type:complete len:282 (+) Transcript_106533:771-1616(+)